MNSSRNSTAGIEALTAQVQSLVSETREYRRQNDKDIENVWQAMKEQGESLKNAVEKQGEALQKQGENFRHSLEKVSNKGTITWPIIVTTAGFILAVATSAALLGDTVMQLRTKILEREQYHLQREIDRNRDEIDRLRSAETKNIP